MARPRRRALLGLRIRKEFAEFDAEKRFQLELPPGADNKACECGAILRGVKKPQDCKLFGTCARRKTRSVPAWCRPKAPAPRTTPTAATRIFNERTKFLNAPRKTALLCRGLSTRCGQLLFSWWPLVPWSWCLGGEVFPMSEVKLCPSARHQARPHRHVARLRWPGHGAADRRTLRRGLRQRISRPGQRRRRAAVPTGRAGW
jgi:hypothetical protein